MSRTITIGEFIKRSNEHHDNKYDYSLVEYKHRNLEVKIICPIHGIFKQKAGIHMNGSECAKCSKIKITGRPSSMSTEKFIKRSIEVHGEKFDYSLVEYKNARTKVKIICPIHGLFEQGPSSHYNDGCGCSLCAKVSFNLIEFYTKDPLGKENGHLYQIKIFDDKEEFYKVGITRRDLSFRFKDLPYEYEIINDIIMSNLECAIKEKEIHNKNKHQTYKPKKDFVGKTECFIKEIRSIVCQV